MCLRDDCYSRSSFFTFSPPNIRNLWHKKVQHVQHFLLILITICLSIYSEKDGGCQKICEYLRSIILRISNLSLRFLHARDPRRLQREVRRRMKPTCRGEEMISVLDWQLRVWWSYHLQARRHWIGQEGRNRLGQNIFYAFSSNLCKIFRLWRAEFVSN